MTDEQHEVFLKQHTAAIAPLIASAPRGFLLSPYGARWFAGSDALYATVVTGAFEAQVALRRISDLYQTQLDDWRQFQTQEAEDWTDTQLLLK